MDQLRTPNEPRLSLYPEIVPHRTGKLRVSPLHEIYFEECGSPTGKPAVLLHGGPGGGINPVMRRYHDPSAYRIVLFDQRGCGRSTPHASLEENTTWHLVDDIERLREHLGIESWHVFGGSWGSTLALAYAETYPERVTELVLRGIFTLRQSELEWFYQEGCSWVFPDAFEAYLRPIPQEERGDMIAAYYRRLTDPDPDIQMEAARAWSAWEGSTLSLIPDSDRVRRFSEEHYALAFARIECHYFINEGFFNADNQLIRDAGRLSGIPGVIVHGRYDVVTPVKIAFDLARAWPEADLRVVPDAGHAMTEPGIVHELVAATSHFANRR
ncbi:prolyl aminopeptidase [Methyloceanibacter sp.]|jgi:proline iminopeptidase|uniref:prolyl aminopeptidase n=1 Tax=Methyloceanibacter sp. TaxID=1965321 RepID=UPI002CFDCE58|nr:prolyl aminopeptidase [Methyloceanibacter sp.]